ncbi:MULTISPECIES: hypothetical protein [unclassified Streptomyces]|uniref:hypothetical protein n=1 Tax=unclassified Streptomyces TaxID=2593676 RepID=UPI0020B8531E|nr:MULTISPECIES: hypothetical protein [unclassified Streptomyces]MCP3760657.1 hypothetical protein [Streptomyces sp. TBY4]WSK18703.1 hypothetical protein OG730_04790 [Streptomyces sp. NBC_01298]
MTDLATDVETVLTEVLGGHERGILSRAIVVAEVLDVDGERSLSVITTPGLSEWDALGLCRYGVLSIEGPAAAYFTRDTE